MVLRYKGDWVKTDKEKLQQMSLSEKGQLLKEYFTEERKYIAERLKSYWIGFVDVNVQNISVTYDKNNYQQEILEISIVTGRHGNGQWFSGIGKDMVEQIVRDWEFSEKKEFELHLDLGCCAYQRYVFTKKQKDMLIEKLKPLLEKNWYKGEGKLDD